MSLLIKLTLAAYSVASFAISFIQEHEATQKVSDCDWYIDPSTREFIEVDR